MPHEIPRLCVCKKFLHGRAKEAVTIGARFLWLQLGVISVDGIRIAEAGGLTCIVDRCLKIEYPRLCGVAG